MSTTNGTSDNGNDPSGLVVLTGELSIHPKAKPVYRVDVTRETVKCTPLAPDGGGGAPRQLIVHVKDIIGCDCLKGKSQADSNGYLALYSYPCRKKIASKKKVRRREVVTLTFSHSTSYDSNIQEAARWKGVVTAVLQRFADNIQDMTTLIPKSPKKLLVLINPFSGPGKALQIFQERVVPMFAEAGLHFNMVVTERAGHAKEIARTMKLDAWHAVVIVSGDGLIFEVVNGLMSRPDWDRARLMPIGALPGGSGNALCCTLNHHAGEPFTDNMVLHSTYVLVKHLVSPMDLVAVDTINRRVYSFLSITWGLIADVDIESEKYRSLGNARFTVGAIARVLGLRTYRGRLSFLPVEEYIPRTRRGGPTRSHSVSNGFETEYARPRPVRSQSVIVVPDNRSMESSGSSEEHPQNGFSQNGLGPNRPSVNDIAIQSPQELERVYPWTTNTNNNMESDPANGDCHTENRPQIADGVMINVNSLQSGNIETTQLNAIANATQEQNGWSSSAHVPTPLLPPLSEAVPEDWVTIEDDFITVAGVFQSHLSADAYSCPDSKLDDGLIYLTFIRAPMSRSRLLHLLVSMEDGSYLQHEGQEMVRVKAFRLEPLQNKGTLSVDGEVVDYGPIQAQVLPSIARVLAKRAN